MSMSYVSPIDNYYSCPRYLRIFAISIPKYYFFAFMRAFRSSITATGVGST